MTMVRGLIRKGAYFDSVTLMNAARGVTGAPGVADAAIVMGTRGNKGILASAGLLLPEFEAAADTDLLIAVKAENETAATAALALAEEQLKKARKSKTSAAEALPMSLDAALKVLPDANVAMISVAGRYAGDEAMKALEAGLHVMLFSDNVSLDQEIELKKFAAPKGLLVMGPDCGTAILNGVPLAFANAVRRGSIGIVAAAGTGLQEVSCLISNEGEGVSQAIGTGGRDVKREVGGIMFIEGLKALGADPATHVILLVSKPPHPDVVGRIEQVVSTIRKPVVSFFLGAEPKNGAPRTLEEAALIAVDLAQDRNPAEARAFIEARDLELEPVAQMEAEARKPGRKYVRGLFSGGTFCTEAQIIFQGQVADLYSNVPSAGAKKLDDSLRSVKNTVIDLGEDEFTVGRPHPMIDYTLRNQRILAEARDPQTAVILLDIVLGYGSHPDPASELGPVLEQACHEVSVVCSITGTDQDPQDRKQVEKVVEDAGAIVMPSNAAACKLAAMIVKRLK